MVTYYDMLFANFLACQARVRIIVSHFHPCLIFAGKARSLSLEWSPIKSFSRAGLKDYCVRLGSGPYLQILN
jgi:hypothetical protein